METLKNLPDYLYVVKKHDTFTMVINENWSYKLQSISNLPNSIFRLGLGRGVL